MCAGALDTKAWTHWDLNPGPSACEADVIPLHHVPDEWLIGCRSDSALVACWSYVWPAVAWGGKQCANQCIVILLAGFWLSPMCGSMKGSTLDALRPLAHEWRICGWLRACAGGRTDRFLDVVGGRVVLRRVAQSMRALADGWRDRWIGELAKGGGITAWLSAWMDGAVHGWIAYWMNSWLAGWMD